MHMRSITEAQFLMRRDGRVVDCTGFENRRGSNLTGGSTPSLSAIMPRGHYYPLKRIKAFPLKGGLSLFKDPRKPGQHRESSRPFVEGDLANEIVCEKPPGTRVGRARIVSLTNRNNLSVS